MACNPSQSFYIKLCFHFYLFSFLSLFLLCLVFYAWFVYSFTYLPHCACTINSAGTIFILPVLFKIRLFAFPFPFPVPSVFLFIVPAEQFKACWPTSFFPVLSKRPRRLISMSLCLLFQGYTCFILSFYPFILHFYRSFIFIYFILSIFLVPVFVFPQVAFSKGNLSSLSDYRG